MLKIQIFWNWNVFICWYLFFLFSWLEFIRFFESLFLFPFSKLKNRKLVKHFSQSLTCLNVHHCVYGSPLTPRLKQNLPDPSPCHVRVTCTGNPQQQTSSSFTLQPKLRLQSVLSERGFVRPLTVPQSTPLLIHVYTLMHAFLYRLSVVLIWCWMLQLDVW